MTSGSNPTVTARRGARFERFSPIHCFEHADRHATPGHFASATPLVGACVGAVMRARGWTGDTDEQPEVTLPVFHPLPTRSSPTRIRVGPITAPAQVANTEEPSFFVHTQAGQAGPFPLGSIRGMLEVGSIADSDLFWDAPANCWRPLAELPPPSS